MEPYGVLEQEFGAWCDRQCVACNSGTAALHLALEALALPPGSEVIVPDFAMIACARAVSLAGLTPVFVDVDPTTLLIDPAKVDRAMTDRTQVIMAVHTYGRRCDMTELHRLAHVYNLHVVEDLAEAHGVPPHPATFAACYSFYKNKIIAGEEGGAVCFAGCDKAERLARCQRSLGFTDKHDFYHHPRGHNYRLANSLATLILQSLRNVEHNLAARWRAVTLYDQHCPPAWRMPPRQAPWVYDLRIPDMTVRLQDTLVETLNGFGTPARHAFKPLSWQPEYRRSDVDCKGLNWNAARAAEEVIYLPLLGVDEEMVWKTYATIRGVVG